MFREIFTGRTCRSKSDVQYIGLEDIFETLSFGRSNTIKEVSADKETQTFFKFLSHFFFLSRIVVVNNIVLMLYNKVNQF